MAACKMNRSTHAVGDGKLLHNSFSSFTRPIYFAARGQQQRLCTSIYAWLASLVCARVHLDTRVHAMHFMQPLVNGALDTDIVPGNANAVERENFIGKPLEITCYYCDEWLFLVSGTGIIVEPVSNYYFRLCLSSILFFGVPLPKQHKNTKRKLIFKKSAEKRRKRTKISTRYQLTKLLLLFVTIKCFKNVVQGGDGCAKGYAFE